MTWLLAPGEPSPYSLLGNLRQAPSLSGPPTPHQGEKCISPHLIPRRTVHLQCSSIPCYTQLAAEESHPIFKTELKHPSVRGLPWDYLWPPGSPGLLGASGPRPAWGISQLFPPWCPVASLTCWKGTEGGRKGGLYPSVDLQHEPSITRLEIAHPGGTQLGWERDLSRLETPQEAGAVRESRRMLELAGRGPPPRFIDGEAEVQRDVWSCVKSNSVAGTPTFLSCSGTRLAYSL